MSGTDTATTTGAGTATETAATTEAATGTGGETTTTATTTAQPTVEQLRADVDKWKAMSRQNEAKLKAGRDTDEAQKKLLAEVAAKLGIQTADGQPDPARITAQLEAAQQQNKSAALEVAVLRAASRLGADGDALLDSRAFLAQLDGLDPAQPEGIAAAVKAAMSGGRYAAGTQAATGTGTAAATAAASTAGTFDGSSGGNRQWTQADVDRATPAQVIEAMNKKLLVQLLGG